MHSPLLGRTFSMCTRYLLVVALVAGAIAAPGCGSSDGGVVPDVGASSDGGMTTGDGGAAAADGDATAGDITSDLDARAAGDAKAGADAKGATPYVSLGTAGNFVVLAGSAITSTGMTVVDGDVGISPGTAITGFPPGVVTGTVHVADAVAATAKQDLNDAYTDAASRSGAPVTLAGDLGGLTLGPGLYYSASSLGLDSGDLTLDAAGNEDAIWVFQIGSSFVTTPNRQVILIGKARPDNVFWNVGTSTTIGLGCTVFGNFLTQVATTWSDIDVRGRDEDAKHLCGADRARADARRRLRASVERRDGGALRAGPPPDTRDDSRSGRAVRQAHRGAPRRSQE